MVKNLPSVQVDAADVGSVPVSGGCPGQGNGNSLQCSGLGNPVDRGVCGATVHGVTKNRTQRSMPTPPVFSVGRWV